MKAIWKVIWIIGLCVLILGAVCIVVGLITGGSVSRLTDTFNANYDVNFYLDALRQLIQSLGII